MEQSPGIDFDYRRLVRFRGPDGRPVGAGCLVNDVLIFTCAHVIDSALGRAKGSSETPSVDIALDLPGLASASSVAACIIPEAWRPTNNGLGDFAALRLRVPLEISVEVPRLSLRFHARHRFRCYGFPSGHNDPVIATGIIEGAMGPRFSWVQLISDGVTGYRVQRGFSGAPVWDDDKKAVVGLVVAEEENDEAARVGTMLPLRYLAAEWPPLGEIVKTSQVFGPGELLTYWDPAARASATTGDRGKSYFTGRSEVLSDVRAWLDAADPTTPVGSVITGPPGSGKSTLLARIATLSYPPYRAAHQEQWRDDNLKVLPPEGAITVALHARNKTLAEICTAIADVTDLDHDDPDKIVGALLNYSDRLVVAIDALDEAAGGGHDIVLRLLQPLAFNGEPSRLRFLVTARPHLAAQLGSGFKALNLGEGDYSDPADLAAYVYVRLTSDIPSQELHLHIQNARKTSVSIAERAHPLFLVARLVADALVKLGGLDHWRGALPSSVQQAFESYLLNAFNPAHARRARDLLRPLAFAQGPGLPADSVWFALASRLAQRTYDQHDLDWLLDAAPSLLATSGSEGDRLFRLFHDALADGFAVTDPSALNAVFETLLNQVPQAGEEISGWQAAPAYVKRHLATHAAKAGRLAELRDDMMFLAVADPRDVLKAQGESGHSLGRHISHALAELIDESNARDAAERAAYLTLYLMRNGTEPTTTPALRGAWHPNWFRNIRELEHAAIPGHSRGVRVIYSTRWDGDRLLLVSGAADGRIVRWDASAATPIAGIDAHIGGVVALGSYSNPREVIVSGGVDGLIATWDAETLTAVTQPRHAHEGKVTALLGTNIDGAPMVLSGGVDGAVKSWDPSTGLACRLFAKAHVGRVSGLAIAVLGPDEQPALVSAGSDGRVRAWNLQTGNLLGEATVENSAQVAAIDVFSRGEQGVLATALDSGDAVLWAISLTDSNRVQFDVIYTTRFPGSPALRDIAFLHGSHSTSVYCVGGSSVYSWDLPGRAWTNELRGREGMAALAATTVGDSELLVVGADDGTVRFWTIKDDQPDLEYRPDLASRHERQHSAGSVTAIAVSPVGDDTVIAAACGGGGSYRTRRKTREGTTETHHWWASSKVDAVVRLFTLNDGSDYADARALKDVTQIGALVLRTTRSGRLFVATGAFNGECRYWSAPSSRVRRRRLGFWGEGVGALVGAEVNGRPSIVSVGLLGPLWVLDPRKRWPRRRRKARLGRNVDVIAVGTIGEHQLVVAPEDTDGDAAIQLWELRKGQRIGGWNTGLDGRVTALAIENSVVAVGGSDGSLRFLNIGDGTGEATGEIFDGHRSEVSVLCSFHSITNTIFVSGGYDGRLLFWPEHEDATCPNEIIVGSPILSLTEAEPGLLVVGTELGILTITIGPARPGVR